MPLIDDNFEDHFMDEHAAPQETQAEHVETPEEREEREIEESTIKRRRNSMKLTMLLVVFVMAVGLILWTWNHFFSYDRQSVTKGWVMNVANEGKIFKTLEIKMITQDYIMDSVKVRWEDDTAIVDGCNMALSLASDSLIQTAVHFKGNGQRVVVYYDEYNAVIPWRGGSRYVATRIELDSSYVAQ